LHTSTFIPQKTVPLFNRSFLTYGVDLSDLGLPQGITPYVLSDTEFKDNFRVDGEYIAPTNEFIETEFGYKLSTGRKNNIGADLPNRGISETVALTANNGVFTFDDSASSIFILNSNGHPYLEFKDSEWRFKPELELLMLSFTATSITVADNSKVNIGDILVIPSDIQLNGVEGEYVLVTNLTGSTTINIQRFTNGVSGLDVNVTNFTPLTGTQNLISNFTKELNDYIMEIATDSTGTHALYNLNTRVTEEEALRIINHSKTTFTDVRYIEEVGNIPENYTSYTADYFQEDAFQNYVQYDGSLNGSTVNSALYPISGSAYASSDWVYVATGSGFNYGANEPFKGLQRYRSGWSPGWNGLHNQTASWIVFKFKNPTVINKYRWKGLYYISSAQYAGNPDTWEIHGSFDGTNWKKLHNFENRGYIGNNVLDIYRTFTNGNPYIYYRFTLIKGAGGTQATGFQNLEYISEPLAPFGNTSAVDRYNLADYISYDPYIMCAEFRVSSLATRGLIGNHKSSTGAGIEITSTGAVFFGADQSVALTGVSMPTNQWGSVILKWDGINFKGFLNISGKDEDWYETAITSPSDVGDMIPTGPFNIGRRGNTGTAFTGDLRHVEVYIGTETDAVVKNWVPGTGAFQKTLDVSTEFRRSTDTTLIFQSRLGSQYSNYDISFTQSGNPIVNSSYMKQLESSYTSYDGIDDAFVDSGSLAPQLTNSGSGTSFTWAVELQPEYGTNTFENQTIFNIPDTSSHSPSNSIILRINKNRIEFIVGTLSVIKNLDTSDEFSVFKNLSSWYRVVAHYNHKSKSMFLSVNVNTIDDIVSGTGIIYPPSLTSELRIGKPLIVAGLQTFTPVWNEDTAKHITVSTGTLTKTSGDVAWSGGIFTNDTIDPIPGNYLEFTGVNITVGHGMCGLDADVVSVNATTSTYAIGDYMWYPRLAGSPSVFQSGGSIGITADNNANGDVYRLLFADAGNGNISMEYYQNGSLKYDSATGGVYVDQNKKYKAYYTPYTVNYAIDTVIMGTVGSGSYYKGKMRNIEMFIGEINNREVLQQWIPGSGMLGDSTLIYQSQIGKGI
jgi:hypothetical protein